MASKLAHSGKITGVTGRRNREARSVNVPKDHWKKRKKKK